MSEGRTLRYMPWCEECAKYWKGDELDETGACPTCGQALGDPPKAPWHFKLLIVAVVIYLGYRLYQGIAWLVGRF